ncbi:hypothetical protein TraAM80_01346 [Trypanosoma rangeli]|uniref:Protein NO VEIN C-terminal domain-containing protein n=1 Tax=Trypanosoma rangeli TaxID=5698 RepID=A0A3S5ISE4_TRYRA|nr:uncharacterized protein TraAM80_01346 [Trypanosoma rangeli]RNF10804.1 hypothetical protein TraAM80_01346 [Trypanosoma rangeli]|eukprot:RNF10804.1 hypothetical protein TraAM80_01346 [Trypanosoma rangeli]
MQRAPAQSMEAIDAYVKQLQSGNNDTSRAPPLTVENLLCKVYAKFYNQRGQAPFPDGLPFSLKQIPSLASVAVLQSRITAMVQSAVATRPVVTLHELEAEVCLAENATVYAELGLGCSLAALPFVQHMFGVRVDTNLAPVTSTEFMQFLLFDANAQGLLAGGGDAGDAARAFSRRYKDGRYTTMQLGIHIQHFPWLLQFVRQEVGRTSAFFFELSTNNTWCHKRNSIIYERVAESLHTALMSRCNDAGKQSREIRFVVRASPEEAQGTDLPPDMWGSCSGPSGGLSLHGVLRAEPFPSPANVAHGTHTSEADKAQQKLPTPVSLSSVSAVSPRPSASTAAAAVMLTGAQKTMPGMVTCLHARKRRRGAVVEERMEVLDDMPLPALNPRLLHVGGACIENKGVTAASTLLPTSSELPRISLEKALSILRCQAAMQPVTGTACFATCDDFALFRTYASKLLSYPRHGGGGAEQYGGVTAAGKDTFSVDLDTILRLLSHKEALNRWYAFYRAIVDYTKGCDETEDVTTTSPGRLLLQCLALGSSDLVFLPLVATRSLLPLSSTRDVLPQRVLLSGRHSSANLLVFHPLQYIVDPQLENEEGCALAMLDGEFLLRGLHDADSQNVLHDLLETLEGCGVLTSVPECWFCDGFLLQLLRRQMWGYFNKAEHTDAEERHMALRMLLLYWWLLGIWCTAPPSSRVAAGVAEVLQSLRDVVWLPALSRHDGGSDAGSSALRIEGWHAPSELFPALPCFTRNNLSEVLSYAPHDIRDLLSLSKQHADNNLFQHLHQFLARWIDVVQSGTANMSGDALPCLMGMPADYTAALALRLLGLLRVGMRISLATMRYLLHRIADTEEEDVLLDARRLPIMPLPVTRAGLEVNEEFIVGEMATCATLCWEPLSGADGACGFDRSIAFIGNDLRNFAVDGLRVSPVPSVATWLAAAQACRRRFVAGSEINASLTDLFLRVLSHSCTTHYSYLLREFEKQHPESHGNAAQEALKGVVHLAAIDTRAEYAFPLHGRWRSPAEGLFYCGPYYCGLSGLALRVSTYPAVYTARNENDAVDEDTTPALPVLAFTQQPHHVVAAVLQKMGLVALEDCTEKIVTFDRMNAAHSAGLHRKIAECVPRVQAFLRTHHPHYYALVHLQVRHALEHFSTVLAAEPVVREVLRFQGHTYTMTRTVRCWYVRQHNCLYGVDEEIVPSLGADVIADVFLPLMDAEVRRGLTSALQEWLRDANLYFDDTSLAPCLPTALVTSSVSEEAWQLSAAPSVRFRDHFPFGRDGFGPTGGRSCTLTASGASAASHAPRMKALMWGDGGYMAHSLPQWRCDLFDSAYDVLRSMERGRSEAKNDSGEEGAATMVTPSAHAQVRRGGRSQRVAPAMVVQEARETADYAVAAERFVAEKLRAEAPPGVEVVWVNEHGEHGTPYDILLVRRTVRDTAASTSTEILAYVEVKSTCTNARRDFEMSLRELLFAARFGRAYKIYRVFRASTSAMRKMHVEVLEDVVRLWRTGSLTMTGDVKVMLAPGA